MPDNDRILGDIRVLDLSEDVAGPFCTRLLAGLGAEVIKVEPPGMGDASRRAGPFVRDIPHAEQSAAFLYLNTGKKSI
ncbi:MAG TPA: CoA transferase, partial [Candidatus Tectomicrobia bacterium]